MPCEQHPHSPDVPVTSPSQKWRECLDCIEERAKAAGIGYVAHRLQDGKEMWRHNPTTNTR